MSGHSKWANIKHKKGKADAARGKIFTKLGREIAIIVRAGGPDPVSNSKLRDVIAKAKANNMPNDNIQRSIKKASGEDGDANYVEISYEGYGPAGTAIIVDCITENRNRTAGDVRHAFEKHGGSLGATGCVSYLFDRKGVLIIENENLDEDEVTLDALEAGADDVQLNDGVYEILTGPNELSAVREALEGKYSLSSAQVDQIPQNTVAPQGEDLEKLLKIIDMLDDLDDVNEVFHNAELPEEEDED
ncbi:MAG: YebC/PmpR family DNA-binding transcriptional regulator [Christensenellaceae bacterium]|jgi:YebC/PmpR family DNA-binding regulatory protein|nr:YebC/PmpR family DNA-binding transcriptional regulator [Christensenellaceae bacterium]